MYLCGPKFERSTQLFLDWSNNIMKKPLNDLNINKSPIIVTFDWENNENPLSENFPQWLRKSSSLFPWILYFNNFYKKFLWKMWYCEHRRQYRGHRKQRTIQWTQRTLVSSMARRHANQAPQTVGGINLKHRLHKNTDSHKCMRKHKTLTTVLKIHQIIKNVGTHLP